MIGRLAWRVWLRQQLGGVGFGNVSCGNNRTTLNLTTTAFL